MFARRKSAPKKLADFEPCIGQIGFLENGAGEIGIRQIAAREVQATQIAKGEHGARPAHPPGIEHFVPRCGGHGLFLRELRKRDARRGHHLSAGNLLLR